MPQEGDAWIPSTTLAMSSRHREGKGLFMTERSTILVTGATGTVGRQVVSQLRARGVFARAVTRNPSAAPFSSGVEVVTADLSDPTSLGPLLREIQAVFLVWPFTAPDLTARLAPQVVEALTTRP